MPSAPLKAYSVAVRRTKESWHGGCAPAEHTRSLSPLFRITRARSSLSLQRCLKPLAWMCGVVLSPVTRPDKRYPFRETVSCTLPLKTVPQLSTALLVPVELKIVMRRSCIYSVPFSYLRLLYNQKKKPPQDTQAMERRGKETKTHFK